MNVKRLILAAGILLLFGCSGMLPPLADRPTPCDSGPGHRSGESLLATLADRNPQLEAFKGIGKVTFTVSGRIQSARVAWMGSGTDKIRMEILTAVGQPALRFADDGRWMTAVFARPLKFVKRRSSGANLHAALGLPISSGDINALIRGRVPVRPHRSAVVLQAGDGPNAAKPTERVLVLKRWWGTAAEKIVFDPSTRQIKKIELYDAGGALDYWAVFEKMQQVDGFLVPLKLVLSNDAGTTLSITVNRYWTAERLDDSLFVLTPPERGGERVD